MSVVGVRVISGGGATVVKPELQRHPSSSRRAAAPFSQARVLGAPACGRLRWAARQSSTVSAAVKNGVAEGEAGAGRKSFYERLGITQEGTAADVKRAYKEMARRYHPDVCPSPECAKEYTRRFIEVQEAYETLSDPGRRALYDRDLARGLHLVFSARRGPHGYHAEEHEVKSQWRNRWQEQLAELKRRKMNRESDGNMSWGARMRRQRQESSPE